MFVNLVISSWPITRRSCRVCCQLTNDWHLDQDECISYRGSMFKDIYLHFGLFKCLTSAALLLTCPSVPAILYLCSLTCLLAPVKEPALFYPQGWTLGQRTWSVWRTCWDVLLLQAPQCVKNADDKYEHKLERVASGLFLRWSGSSLGKGHLQESSVHTLEYIVNFTILLKAFYSYS